MDYLIAYVIRCSPSLSLTTFLFGHPALTIALQLHPVDIEKKLHLAMLLSIVSEELCNGFVFCGIDNVRKEVTLAVSGRCGDAA